MRRTTSLFASGLLTAFLTLAPAAVSSAAAADTPEACAGAFTAGRSSECTFWHTGGRVVIGAGVGAPGLPWITIRTITGEFVAYGCTASGPGVCTTTGDASEIPFGTTLVCHVDPLLSGALGSGTFACGSGPL